MKQVIPFKKDIIFKTKISDITSISLEHSLMRSEGNVSGEFILSGDYKMTEASVNKEDFFYKLPFDIALDSRYDTSKLKIEIEDFYYEIINSDVLRVNIEVSLDGLEEKQEEKEPTILDIDEDTFLDLEEQIDVLQEELVRNHEHVNKLNEQIFEEINDTNIIDYPNEIKMPESEIIEQNFTTQSEEINMNNNEKEIEKNTIDTNEIKSLFNNISDEETFSTYHVYIMRSEDTIESIMTKYNINKDELSKYNDLDNIKLGDKVIIPALVND